ncbi:hypothetical protein K469DRAFT_691749 [Zopfia rhizophila CBS 207.26]|uniref:Uncharacterized protein n=1 Tax=Zopfia rhizophila CBS 207.26 TaxID=1314779 RepID=A0A6A6DS15_9PEZI|nr:hypothetical protein K469DRAFT_691749 [Zopfia rhizophila CBS 207.26]
MAKSLSGASVPRHRKHRISGFIQSLTSGFKMNSTTAIPDINSQYRNGPAIDGATNSSAQLDCGTGTLFTDNSSAFAKELWQSLSIITPTQATSINDKSPKTKTKINSLATQTSFIQLKPVEQQYVTTSVQTEPVTPPSEVIFKAENERHVRGLKNKATRRLVCKEYGQQLPQLQNGVDTITNERDELHTQKQDDKELITELRDESQSERRRLADAYQEIVAH